MQIRHLIEALQHYDPYQDIEILDFHNNNPAAVWLKTIDGKIYIKPDDSAIYQRL